MNRRVLFFRGLLAGYGTVAANFLFTVISVPLALHYLPKEEFGLWALVLQIGGFLMLLDFGMSTSVSRFLADHKDSVAGGAYGNVLETGRRMFLVQSLALVTLATVAAWGLPPWLDLPTNLVAEFQKLVVLQGTILAMGLAVRGKIVPLWAHQRIDITQMASSTSLLISLAVLAAGFYIGWGLDALWISAGVGALWTNAWQWMACRHLRFYPPPGRRGSFQSGLFVQMLRFGRDVLLMQLGNLLCQGSQIVLVTKLLGLESAAVFSVATKTLTMATQLISRILESAAPGLTELFVRGERGRFSQRFCQLFTISLIAATSLSVGLLLANRDFVSIWTRGSIGWTKSGDALLALILIMTIAVRSAQGVFGMTADFSRIKWLAFSEGTLFITATLLAAPFVSLEEILALALAAQIFSSLLPSIFQTFKFFPNKSFWFANALWIGATMATALLLDIFLGDLCRKPISRMGLAAFGSVLAALILVGGLKKQIKGIR